MPSLRLPLLVLAMLGASACSTLTNVPSQDKLDRMPPAGYGFDKALFEAYRGYASGQGGYDSWYFRKKADAVGFGDTPLPENPDQWGIGGEERDRMMADGARLAVYLEDDHSARIRAPVQAAQAQASYDCWVAETGDGDDGIAAQCRDDFYKAMAALTPIMDPPAQSFSIRFATGSASLDRADLETVRRVAAERLRTRIYAVQVVGFADTTGSVPANQRLSERRTDAVYHALLRAGVPEPNIARLSYGEARLPEPTPDGTPEAENRSVTVRFW